MNCLKLESESKTMQSEDQYTQNIFDVYLDGLHLNYMNGVSFYAKNPLVELEMILYSSFLHEPSFYNPAMDSDIKQDVHKHLEHFLLFPSHNLKSRQRIFFDSANRALSYDFKNTLQLAVKARRQFFMRKSPCELIAIAAAHVERPNFNKNNELFFRKIVKDVCYIPPDMISILDSWKLLKGSKAGFPTILKKAFCDILEELSPYHMNKYRRACIDAINIAHPKENAYMKELLKSGKIKMEEKNLTWETLMCQYGSWEKTLSKLEWKLPHMACLRNLRGFALKVRDEKLIRRYCDILEEGVIGGKQFPFQYLTAYESLDRVSKTFSRRNDNKVFYKKGIRKCDLAIMKESLERCIQKSIETLPKLKGETIILTDNSGSAWNSFQSSYGSKTIAEIGNMSALITGLSCEGPCVIGLFGDTLIEYEVDKKKSFFENYNAIQEIVGTRGKNVGLNTENGLWVFFKRAMKNPEKYKFDNFFCYSDQQAGHGGLYGCDPEMDKEWYWPCENENRGNYNYIHLPKLIEHYRTIINKKLNVFTVQTAGYNDSICPQSLYRYDILAGWTGQESTFAYQKIQLWDKLEQN
jgi:hypothetical protein